MRPIDGTAPARADLDITRVHLELRARAAEEFGRQDRKWGLQDHKLGDWWLILSEELGEAAQAIVQGNSLQALQELAQVSALVVRVYEKVLRQGLLSNEICQLCHQAPTQGGSDICSGCEDLVDEECQ